MQNTRPLKKIRQQKTTQTPLYNFRKSIKGEAIFFYAKYSGIQKKKVSKYRLKQLPIIFVNQSMGE